jgi:putative thioredoxin
LRVAKLDADACRGLAEALQVKAFPTVVAFHRGAATDSFVGILPQADLQAFFLRAVGAPVGQDGKPVPPRKVDANAVPTRSTFVRNIYW